MSARRARSALTVAAVALGVALVVAVTGLHETLRRSLFDWIKRWTGPADLVVNLDAKPEPPDPDDPAEAAALADRIRALPGVAAVHPRLYLFSDSLSVTSAKHALPVGLSVMGIRVEPNTPGGRLEDRSPKLVRGRHFRPDETDVILLDDSIAGILQIAPGDTLILPAAYPGTPFARPAVAVTVVGTFDASDLLIGGVPPAVAYGAAFAPLASLQRWTGEPGMVNRLDVTLAPNLTPQARTDTLDALRRTVAHRGGVRLRDESTYVNEFKGPMAGAVVNLSTRLRTAKLLAHVRALPGVKSASVRVVLADLTLNLRTPGRSASVRVVGVPVDPPPASRFEPLQSGRWFANEPDAVVLEAAAASALGAEVGSQIELDLAPRRLTVVGILAEAPSRKGAPWAVVPQALAASWSLEPDPVNRFDVIIDPVLNELAKPRLAEQIRWLVAGWGEPQSQSAGSAVEPGSKDAGIVVRRDIPLRADRLLQRLAAVPGVAVASPRLSLLSRFVPVASTAKPAGEPIQFVGIDVDHEHPLLGLADRIPPLLKGRAPALGERDVLLLDSDTAAKLQLSVGDSVDLPVLYRGTAYERPAEKATLIGIFATAQVGAAKGIGSGAAPLNTLGRWLLEPGLINRIDIAFEPDLPDARRRELPSEISAVVGDRGRVQSWSARQEQIEKNLGLVKLAIQLISMAALLCSVFIVFNTLSINVVERIHIIGMMRCLGTTRGQTAAMVFFESLVVGLAGVLVGVPLGLAAWASVTAVFSEQLTVAAVSYEGVGLAVAGGLLSSLLAAVLPAIHAVRVSPIAAVRNAKSEGRGWFLRWSWILGLACLAIQAAVMFGASDPRTKLDNHIFVGLPLIFLGFFLLAPVITRLAAPLVIRAILEPGARAVMLGLGTGAAAAAVTHAFHPIVAAVDVLWLLPAGALAGVVAVLARRIPSPLPVQLAANSLNQQQRALAMAACALMVGGGLVVNLTVNSDSLIDTWFSNIPDTFPDMYAVGPGSYAEDLAVRYYRKNKARVDAAKADPFADPEAAEIAELVRFDNVEKSWNPLLAAWRKANHLPPGDDGFISDIYLQDVELTRPLYQDMDGLLPRESAMLAVDPDTFFDRLPMKFVRGDREAALQRLREGGAALVPKSLYASQQIDVGHKFTVNLDKPKGATKTFEVVGVVELGVLEVVFLYLDPTAGPDSLSATLFVVGQVDAVARIDKRGLRDPNYAYRSRGALIPQKIVVGNFSPGADRGVTALRAAAPALIIDSVRELLDKLVDEFRRIVGMVRSIGWITLCIAGLGVANVILMKILRQRRQIGVLRALGMTRLQTAALVLVESAAVGVVGGLMGVVLGIHLGIMARHLDNAVFGLEYGLVIPLGYAAFTLAVSVVICLAAGLLPARRAARMKIISALART